MALVPLSEAARRQNDLQAAERFATEAIEAASSTAWQAAALVQYGMVLNELDDFQAAEVATRRGLRVALDGGLGHWFRIALRELARAAARRASWEEAATFLVASRQDMPAPTLEPAVYGPLEERCREALGDERFERLAARGAALTHDQLVDLANGDEAQPAATVR
jgi:hypothetical protein